MAGSLSKLCERMRYWCDEANLGYDQGNRQDIRPGGECDCSSLVIFALKEAGFDAGDATYTGNLSAALTARGWKRIAPYPQTTPKPGDILLNDANHVAVCTAPGMMSYASIDERGKASGGQSGDQTGLETKTVSGFTYARGWNCILRYEGPQDSIQAASSGKNDQPKEPEVKSIENMGGDVYRLYNVNTGQHMYALKGEADTLVKAGWKMEDVAFKAPKGGVHAVYRMYNPNTGAHMFTKDFNEAASLEKSGWMYEGVRFFGATSGKEVYRVYNPNNGDHVLTCDAKERDALTKAGWKNEGVAFLAA